MLIRETFVFMRSQLTSWKDYLVLSCIDTVLHFTVTFRRLILSLKNLPSTAVEGLINVKEFTM